MGTTWYRIHAVKYGGVEFNPSAPTVFQGGRFDCTDGSFSYLYGAEDWCTAVAETLIRDADFDLRGERMIKPEVLQGRVVSEIWFSEDIPVVDLTDADGLAAVKQDTWLTQSLPREYVATREWCAAIRKWSPTAAGLLWRPRHDPGRLVWVLFEDRANTPRFRASARLQCRGSTSIEAGSGRRRIEACLARRGVHFGPTSP